MKKLLLLLCMLSFLQVAAQENKEETLEEFSINLSVYQDMRLFFIGDDRGNDALTPNVILRFDVEAFKIKKSHIYFYIGAEYADLASASLQRYFLGFGYSTSFPFLKKFDFGVYGDHGITLRGKNSFLADNDSTGENSFMGISVNFETTYKINDKVRFSLIYQVIDRRDLTARFDTDNRYRGSVFFGAKFPL